MALKNGKLKSLLHERFAQLVVDGTDPRQAYEIVGLKPNRANHFRLLRRPKVGGKDPRTEASPRGCCALRQGADRSNFG